MDITSFIPSQRQAILERFQQVEALGLGAIRIELKGCESCWYHL